MTNTHIDQLRAMWDSAERDPNPRKGDLLIFRPDERGVCEVKISGHDRSVGTDYARILARAPKPKPAWHEAVAVMADDGDGDRMVWTRLDGTEGWESADGFIRSPNDLNDPVPLIEAKVTDEMVKRAVDKAEALGYIERVFGEIDSIDQSAMSAILAAALWIETE